MNNICKWLFVAVAVSLQPACMSMRSYVDTEHYEDANYESLWRLSEPIPVDLHVEFQRSGRPLPAVDQELRSHVERILRASGVFVPAPGTGRAMTVTANNYGDAAGAALKGVGTGLSLGAFGSTVTDKYEFTCTYVDADGLENRQHFQHAIHTTVGRARAPQGLTPTTSSDAFGHVVEDVMVTYIRALQQSGIIAGVP